MWSDTILHNGRSINIADVNAFIYTCSFYDIFCFRNGFYTGCYGLAYTGIFSALFYRLFYNGCKAKKCQTCVAVIASVLQFIFALDVVSLFCMSLMERR